MTEVKRIRDAQHLAEAVAALVAADAKLAAIVAAAGELSHPESAEGFEALMEIIVSQQLSAAAADTIFARLKARIVPFDPATLLATPEAVLRQAGLSAPKQRHMRSIASRIQSGELDLDRLAELDDEEARAHLMKTKGIGPWTADIYLMFSHQRADMWPVNDVALQAAVAAAFGLRKRPDANKLEKLGERWRPWRSVAARLFWRHYRTTRQAQKERQRAEGSSVKRRKRKQSKRSKGKTHERSRAKSVKKRRRSQ